MNIKYWLLAVYLLTDSISVVAASFPSLVPILPSVVARSGHNATLVCMGQNMESWYSFLVWKFNGTEIKEGENKKVSQKFFPGRKVNLTLLITNVKEKDVGEYTCEAFIGNFDSTDRCKAVIELKVYRKAKWPKGTYALPMAKTGCPGSHGFSWSEGSLRQDTEDTRPQNTWSQPLHLNGEMKKDAIWQQFCVKENELGDDDWPQGNYCIYKKKTCPAGFSEGWIKWDDEDTKNENSVSGVLPEGTFNEDTTVYFCCRSDGSAHSPISLPRSQPFFLFKHSGRCQAVMGMRVREEWMFWDCEDLENTNRHFGTIPAALITKDIKVFYCYYSKK